MTVVFRTQKIGSNSVYFDFVTLNPSGGSTALQFNSLTDWILGK